MTLVKQNTNQAFSADLKHQHRFRCTQTPWLDKLSAKNSQKLNEQCSRDSPIATCDVKQIPARKCIMTNFKSTNTVKILE